jgi:hypothetical protein
MVSVEKLHKNIGEVIDKIVSIEMRDQRPTQGVIEQLYRAARDRFQDPLTMRAALLLKERLAPGDVACIVTGAGIKDYLPAGETDGPMGAAAVARILRFGLNVVPVVLTQEEYVENVRATMVAGGVGVRNLEVARRVPYTGVVLPFPSDDEAAAKEAERIVQELSPKAFIAIEALGPNKEGVAHTSEGRAGDPGRARFEYLFDLAADQGIATVGIGDNGNEIGFGAMLEDVHRIRIWGKECQCPCGGGMATRVGADALIVAGVSNWGAYGLEAALAALLERPDLLHDSDAERFMLHECVRTGAADGAGHQTLTVDGTPASVQVAVLELLRSTITICIKPPRKRPY